MTATQVSVCPPPVAAHAAAPVVAHGLSGGDVGECTLVTFRRGIQVVEHRVFSFDVFLFDPVVPLFVFHDFLQFVVEATVFKKPEDSALLGVRVRADGNAYLTGAVLNADVRDVGVVVPLVQALQAVEQLFFSVNRCGRSIQVKLQGVPPGLRSSIIARRLRRARGMARRALLA